MKKRKLTATAMAALLVGGATVPYAVFAEEKTPISETETEMQVHPDFIKVTGTVSDIEKGEDFTLYTILDGEDINKIAVSEKTLLFDNTGKKAELKKGDKVEAFTDADKPMIMIYPPQYSPEVVIVQTDEMGSVAVGKFDEDLLNEQLSLKLNVGEDTKIISASGKDVTEADLTNQELVVFYTITTRSIPAQTPPEMIIILDQKEEDSVIDNEEGTDDDDAAVTDELKAQIDKMIEADHHIVGGVKMVPLRKLAEALGYEVLSTGDGAILKKDALTYTITRGQKEYGYNKSLRKFERAPELLEKWKTYVPVNLIEEMMEME